jgi:hypothetical protein
VVVIDRQEKVMDSRGAERRRARIRVDGPLAPFADGVRGELLGIGYAEDTVCDHMHLLADLSGWLAGQGLVAAGLTSEAADGFLRARREGTRGLHKNDHRTPIARTCGRRG